MLLSILIPTYNRRDDIFKNIAMLADYISTLNQSRDIQIIISDNASPDGTYTIITELIASRPEVAMTLIKQASNIGLEANALALLAAADTPYVMFCGDDDFLSIEYLRVVLEELESANPPTVIVPDFIRVTREGLILGQRNPEKKTTRYQKGKWNAAIRMYLGHQLSGLTLWREGLLEAYEQRRADNIYPFIFFLGFNMLRGELMHLTDFPVQVTEGAQKDWGYGADGLISDRVKNYSALFGKFSLYRLIGEITSLWKHARHVHHAYLRKGLGNYLRHLWAVFGSDNLSLPGKLIYLPLNIIFIFVNLSKRVIR
ncbi:MAG: glycosyltransferase family 2 protein [Candidatus Marinimicrobia bacterium]|nr:glycosyltransferase family 2 protein [Candidatus Neomarinimicrobiota bacterium]